MAGLIPTRPFNRFAKIMRLREQCAMKIQRIVNKLGLCGSITSREMDLIDLPAAQLTDVLQELLSKDCTTLLRDEEEMEILMTPALKLSLSLGLTVVDLTAYLSYCPIDRKYEYLKEAVGLISEIAPSVKELKLTSKLNRFFRFPRIAICIELLEALSRLTELRLLQIDDLCFVDSLNDLIHLCEHLQKLEYLSVNFPNDIDDIDFEEQKIAERFKKSMPNLRVFIYNASAYAYMRRLCMENVPNLQIIEQYASELSPELNHSISETLETGGGSGRSHLRHLMVDFSQESASENIHMAYPSVSHLRIYWNPPNIDDCHWQRLLQFPEIESLQMINFPLYVLNCFLETYGSNIRALTINQNFSEVDTKITFKLISTACPKLERLSLQTIIDDQEPVIFPFLQEVNLNFKSLSGSHNELSNILMAPALKKVTLHCSSFAAEDLKKLSSLISNELILQHLECLHIELKKLSIGRLAANIAHFKETVELIKCASNKLKNLTHVKFYMNYRKIEYSLLARSLRDGKTDIEDLPDVSLFFSDLPDIDDDRELISWFVDENLISILDN